MNYYHILRIEPNIDLNYISLSTRKEILLQYAQEQAGDRSRLNEIIVAHAFLSRHLYEYYDYIVNPNSQHKVPNADLCTTEMVYEPTELTFPINHSQIFLVEMESFAILTPEKICYVYSRQEDYNLFNLNIYKKYFDVDSLFVNGVSKCMILVLQGHAQVPFKAIAHVAVYQNLHKVHAYLIASIESQLGKITSLNEFIFGGTANSSLRIMATQEAQGFPLVEKESLLMNRDDRNDQSNIDDKLTIILDTNNIYIEQDTVDHAGELIVNFYKQDYNMQHPLEQLDLGWDSASESDHSPSP